MMIAGLLVVGGIRPTVGGRLSLLYVAVLSLADTLLLVSLILWFLRARGERPREVFLGRRSVLREAGLGLLLVLPTAMVAAFVVAVVRASAPWLHNLPANPFEALIGSLRDVWVFGAVAVIAGGLREELQRAFVLHRFDQHLGGGWLGLALFSVAFGAGHIIQGWDVAIATAALGAFWGAMYLLRRSVAAPLVAHAAFNLAEILQHWLLRVQSGA
jgi:membrane protease YdiL (CAAX protease family)